ncbi:plant self-incompatibility protein S1 family [Striga asiatica]|uniref:S-protein homolog n=1 Tax=Striga asiatica TaxID=4170 RepID=A0A5A7NX09_STRAF|nr:plant self-incompatibility protein S1 family [Striga asiatica]
MGITLAKILLISYFCLVLLLHSSYAPPFPGQGEPEPFHPSSYQVWITDLIQRPSLTFRCQSKDNDLGYHTLNFRQKYHWEFKLNFWGSTLFFCHFYWNGKQQVFDVFNGRKDHFTVINWVVKEDGFYKVVGKVNWEDKDLVKAYSWS